MRNVDRLPVVTVRRGQEVNWIPVEFHQLWRSKYNSAKEGKRRHHDFWIEVEVAIGSRLPYELVCTDHFYESEHIRYEEEVVRVPVVRTNYMVTIVACGHTRTTVIRYNEVSSCQTKLLAILSEMCKRKVSKKTLKEWLAVDLGYWFPFDFPKYAITANKILSIAHKLEEEGYTDVSKPPYLLKKVIPVRTKEYENTLEIVPKKEVSRVFESADEFQDYMASEVCEKLDQLIDEFITEVYAMPQALEFKEETEGGYERLIAECILRTGNVITDKIESVEPIEENTNILYVSFRRSNNVAMEPVTYINWERELENFIAKYLDEIKNKIESAYLKHIEELLGGGGGE